MSNEFEIEKEVQEPRKSRNLTLNLTDTDAESIGKAAAAVGFSVGELLENFIADLIDGRGTNGSDERAVAREWFDRCWFGMFPDETFLRYELQYGNIGVEYIIELYDDLKGYETNVVHTKQELEKGVNIERHTGREYSWNELIDSNGNPFYTTFEAWTEFKQEYVEQEQEQATYIREQLQDEWNSFLEWTDKTDLTLETEIEKLIEWKAETEKELRPFEAKAKHKTPDISLAR